MLAVGTLEPRKNLPRLAEATRRPRRRAARRRRARLGRRRGRRRRRPLARRASTTTELARLYRGALCVAYPSLYEGFGLPVLEAMACGAPVVTSAGTAMEEVADGAAVLVDPLDVASIADGHRAGDRAARRARRAAASSARAAFTLGRRGRARRAASTGRPHVPDAARRRSTPTCSAGNRTGDETYVENLLRELPAARADGLRLAAVTRRPDLVPPGVEPVELRARLAGAAHGAGAAAAAAPPAARARALPARAAARLLRVPAVVTVHDLSFERDPTLMGRADRLVFRTVVPRAARRAARVLAVSERTRRDLRRALRRARRRDRRHAERRRSARSRPDGATRERLPPLRRRDPGAEGPARRGRRGRGRSGAGSSSSARRRSRRSRASSSAAAPTCAATSTSRSSPSSTAAPPRSCSRRATRASGCPCSRRWRAARRSSPRPSRRCARSPATRRSTRSADELRRRRCERALAERERLAPPGSSARARFTWDETARRTVDVYREVLGREGLRGRRLARPRRRARRRSLPALAPQVDELVVVANVPGQRRRRSRTACACSRTRARSASPRTRTAASPRRAASSSLVANPDAVPEPDAVAALAAFADAHPRCGVAGPADALPGRDLAAVAPPLPDRRRDARPAHAAALAASARSSGSARHYHLDERPTEPVQADWMLGAFLLLRRTMLDELGGFDAGFRIYGEDIDLCYRAAKAGLGALVRAGRGRPPRATTRTSDRRFLTRRTLWHWRGILALRAQAPRAAARGAMTDKAGQYDRAAERWTEDGVRRPGRATSRAARELVVGLGPRSRPGERRARPRVRRRRPRRAPARARRRLPRRRRRARRWSRRRGARLGDARRRARRPERLRAAGAGRRDDRLPRDLLRRRPARVLPPRRRATRARSSSSTSTRASTGSRTCAPTCARRASTRVELRPFFMPQTHALAAPAAARLLVAAERTGPLARLALRCRFTYVVAAFRARSGSRPSRRAGAGRRRRGSSSAGTNVGSTVTATRNGGVGVGIANVRSVSLWIVARRASRSRSPSAGCLSSPIDERADLDA